MEDVVSYISKKVGEDTKKGMKTAVIASEETKDAYPADAHIISVGLREDEDEIARHLYNALRECDELNVDSIYSEDFNTPRMGQAIMNRLIKAAGHNMIRV